MSTSDKFAIMSSSTKYSTNKKTPKNEINKFSSKLGYWQSPPQKERLMYMTPGEMMNSKSTTIQTSTAKLGKES